jgi:hypothetical protein
MQYRNFEMPTSEVLSCLICGLTTCRSVPGGPSSPVRCFLTSSEAKRREDLRAGIIRGLFCFRWRYPPLVPGDTSVIHLERPRLLHLPNEILIQITSHLSGLEIYLFRSTCCKLRTLLEERKPPYIPDAQGIEMLVAMLQRESFRKGCRLERRRGLKANRGMCSVCLQAHFPDAFTPTEWSGPPESRVCRGGTEAVKICLHKWFSFEQLKANLSEPGDVPLPYEDGPLVLPLSCLDTSHQSSKGDIPPHISIQWEWGNGGKRAPSVPLIRILWTYQLAIDGWLDKERSAAALRDSMLDVTGLFCPHILVSEFCQYFLQKLPGVWKRVRAKCPDEFCVTEITLNRESKENFRLSTSRELRLDCLDDPRWLAQLPGPSADNIDRVWHWRECN